MIARRVEEVLRMDLAHGMPNPCANPPAPYRGRGGAWGRC